MVRVKGGEWGHVSVVKEPAKHGMAWHVKCSHCGKVFQGNAMRIRSHLLGHPEKVSGCPACPPEAREELRLSYLAKSQVERKKRRGRTLKTSRASQQNLENAQRKDCMIDMQRKGDKLSMEQAFRSMVFQAGGIPAKFVTLSPIKPVVRPFAYIRIMIHWMNIGHNWTEIISVSVRQGMAEFLELLICITFIRSDVHLGVDSVSFHSTGANIPNPTCSRMV